MTLTAHSLVGAAVATFIPNPAISLPLCLVLHFVTDKLPHWDTMTDKGKTKQRILLESLADMSLGFLLPSLIFLNLFPATVSPALLFAAIFFSQLPDLMEFPYIILHWKIPGLYEDYKFQHWVHDLWFNSRLKAPWGIVTQAVLATIFLLWAINK